MPYLTYSDYRKQIQDVNLNQIIGNDTSILESAQLAAQAEALSYIRQKYDVSQEFTNTLPYSKTATYKAGDRIVIDFPDYVSSTTYNINDLVVNAGKGYVNTATTTGAFDPSKWTLLGHQYDIYYVTYPFPQFNTQSLYNVGDRVIYNNTVYTCRITSRILTGNDALQYGTYNNLPVRNIFPNNPTQGAQYWGSPTAYTVAAGILPTDTTKWTKGDNRDQQMIMYFIDITLYHLHSRIAPRNIPQMRVDRYNNAKEWLIMVANGSITPQLPEIQTSTPTGGRVRYGGNVKINNFY